MTTDIPSGQISTQSQTDSPLAGYDNALVDDTVVLVDGASTLVGSESTPIEPQKTRVIITTPRPTIGVTR